MPKPIPTDTSTAPSTTRSRLSKVREDELLNIAAQVFAERGFDGASVGEMAKRANASKGTFYSRFETKERLLVAVVERHVSGLENRMSGVMQLDVDVEAALTTFATETLTVVLSDEVLSSYRVVTLEGLRFPELSKLYYGNGPEKIARFLSDYLLKLTQQGKLTVTHPLVTAEQFIDSIVGMPRLRAALGIGRPTKKETQQRIEVAVTAFMRAYGPAKKR